MQMVSWLYLLALTLGSWWLISWSFAWAVLAGGVICNVSFISLHKDVMSLVESLTPDKNDGSGESIKSKGQEEIKKRIKIGIIFRFWLRIAVIGILLVLLIRNGQVNVFGLITGLSTMVFTITFTAVSVARRYLFSRR